MSFFFQLKIEFFVDKGKAIEFEVKLRVLLSETNELRRGYAQIKTRINPRSFSKYRKLLITFSGFFRARYCFEVLKKKTVGI